MPVDSGTLDKGCLLNVKVILLLAEVPVTQGTLNFSWETRANEKLLLLTDGLLLTHGKGNDGEKFFLFLFY